LFRPPYVGAQKPYYSTDDLKTDLLPSYNPVDNAPTLQSVESRFQRVQLDHKGGAIGRYLHPVENIPDYGGDIGSRNGDAALRLMLNDPIADRTFALIAYLQYGIDLYHMALDGHIWPAGGGHRPGQKLPLVFSAVMLENQDMKDAVMAADFLHEEKLAGVGRHAGITIYGSTEGYGFETWERKYWVSTGSA